VTDPPPLIDRRLLRRLLLAGAVVLLVALGSVLIWCGPAPGPQPRPSPVATLTPLPEPTDHPQSPYIRPTLVMPSLRPAPTPPPEMGGKG
jgi:hypothetical protein